MARWHMGHMDMDMDHMDMDMDMDMVEGGAREVASSGHGCPPLVLRAGHHHPSRLRHRG